MRKQSQHRLHHVPAIVGHHVHAAVHMVGDDAYYGLDDEQYACVS